MKMVVCTVGFPFSSSEGLVKEVFFSEQFNYHKVKKHNPFRNGQNVEIWLGGKFCDDIMCKFFPLQCPDSELVLVGLQAVQNDA